MIRDEQSELQQSPFGRHLWFQNICAIAVMKLELNNKSTLTLRVHLVILLRTIATMYINKLSLRVEPISCTQKNATYFFCLNGSLF